jgi:hypothetical protein
MTASSVLFALSALFFMMGVVMTFCPPAYRRVLWEGVAWVISILMLAFAMWLCVSH